MTISQNIFIIGFRACGKTTLAERISQSSGLTFMDTDHELQQKAGMSISDLVKRYGWESFRDMEERVVAVTASLTGRVVSTGGGVILRENNRKILKNSAFLTVYLQADPGLILHRLQADPGLDQRPPLTDFTLEQEVVKTLSQREPLYLECADLVLDAGMNPQLLSQLVLEAFS